MTKMLMELHSSHGKDALISSLMLNDLNSENGMCFGVENAKLQHGGKWHSDYSMQISHPLWAEIWLGASPLSKNLTKKVRFPRRRNSCIVEIAPPQYDSRNEAANVHQIARALSYL